MKFEKILTLILFICLIVSISATIYIIVTPHVGERFTEFYILGPSGKAGNYPVNLTIGEAGMVIIGIVNHEYDNVTYKVVIFLDNITIGVLENIKLRHEEIWQQNYTFIPNKVGNRLKLEFHLYKEGIDEPYIKLHLWITVHPKE